MRIPVPVCAVALSLAVGVAAHAQDTTVKNQLRVKGDHARSVVMTGCLQPGEGSDGFMLTGVIARSGKELKSNSTFKKDVDKDETTVKAEAHSKVEGGDHSVGTSGASYVVTAREGVDLASHVGQQVQIAAVMVEAGKGRAKVEVEDQSRVSTEHAPDAKDKSTAKLEIPRGPSPRLLAMSVMPLGESCSTQP